MRRWISVMLAVMVVVIAVALYWDTGTLWQNQYDDSYITYRYAVNLASSHGLVFNPGERTDAASSFLYTIALAAVYRCGWHDLEAVSFVFNIAAIGFIAVFVCLGAYRLSRNLWASIILGLLASLHGFVSGWAVLGMDTVPFAALLCALAWAIIDCRHTLALWLVCAAVLARPEGILVVPFWWWVLKAKGMNRHDDITRHG